MFCKKGVLKKIKEKIQKMFSKNILERLYLSLNGIYLMAYNYRKVSTFRVQKFGTDAIFHQGNLLVSIINGINSPEMFQFYSVRNYSKSAHAVFGNTLVM